MGFSSAAFIGGNGMALDRQASEFLKLVVGALPVEALTPEQN
jgi:hypothetical protein